MRVRFTLLIFTLHLVTHLTILLSDKIFFAKKKERERECLF